MTALYLALVFVASTSAVFAQPVVPGRVTLSLGGRWSGSTPVDSRDATLTRPDDGRFSLFSTTSEEGRAGAIEGRFGVRVTDALHFEASVSYGHFDLRSRVTADAEETLDLTVSETITQLTVETGFVEHLPSVALGQRIVPFFSLGGGFARQLHEGRTLVETAGFGYLGGGIALLAFTRPGTGLKAVVVRLDVRGRLRSGGVALDDGVHLAPEAGASIVVSY